MKDKKKLMAIAALGAVLVGMGAFTLLGGSEPPPPPVVSKKDTAKTADAAKVAAEAEGPKNPSVASALPQRDPFKDAMLQSDAPKVAAPQLPPPVKAHVSRPRFNGSGDQLPVLPQFDKSGTLAGQIGVQAAGPDPSAFNYRVSGVIVGARPAAVFTDSQGNQRLVSVGASLDGDSKVLAIDRGQVTVQYRGKTLRLTLGGTPNEK